MKFTCNRVKLLEIMAVMQNISPVNSNVQVLQNVKFLGSPKKENIITISATDYEVGATVDFAVENLVDPGQVLVNAHDLHASLNSEKSENIDFETVDTELIVSTSRSRLSFAICQDTFADIEDFSSKQPLFTLSLADFRYGIDCTKFAIEMNAGRYAFNGIFISIKNKDIDFVASDGKRLSVVKKTLSGDNDKDSQAILPIKGLMSFLQFVSANNGGEISLQFNEREMIAKVGEIRFMTRLLEGMFPDYQRVIPTDTNISITVKKSDFSDGLKLVKNFCVKEDPYIEVVAKNGKVCLSGKTDKGRGKNEIDANIIGGEMDSSFNVNYLIDLVGAIRDDEITLKLQQNGKPALITEGDFRHVLSPVVR